MLENNLLYQDDYMFFTFNGIYSKDHNLMIQNTNNSLVLYTNDGTSIDYVSPKYQEGRYVMGVTRSHCKFPYKMVAYGLTRAEVNNIAQWLRMGTQGYLMFDYAPDWKYNVIVASLGDITLHTIDALHFIASFDITFETIEGTEAESVDFANLIYEGEFTKSQETTEIYACNNTIYVPTIALYKTTDDYDNRYTSTSIAYPFYIHHLGDKSVISVTTTNASNDTNVIARLKIDTHEFINKTYEIKFEMMGDNTVIDYKPNTNLFFINDLLPSMQYKNAQIQELKIECDTDPLCIYSPGRIVKIVDDNINATQNTKHWPILNKITNTHYNWFVYCTDQDPISSEYFNLDNNGDIIYSYDPNGYFCYDTEYTIDQLKDHLMINKPKNVYFGFYTIVECIINQHTCQNISMSVRQYVNFISREKT